MTRNKKHLQKIMKRKRLQKQPPADLSVIETERVFQVELPQEGMRVDRFVLERTPWMSRTKATIAFDEERVLKNDQPVAPGKKLRAGDIVKLILQELGRPESLIQFVQDRPGHDMRYAIDAAKIRRELGWSPAVDFASGLKKTITWYREHTEWADALRLRVHAGQ